MKRKIKSTLKSILPPSLLMPIKIFLARERRLDSIEKNLQRLFSHTYNLNHKDKKTLLKAKEFKIYSQNGEDGILQYIFSQIGIKNKKFVEFGIEDGRQCNTANLSINFGWQGILIEGNKNEFLNAKYYYYKMNNIKPSQVKIVHCFITKNNINSLLVKNGFKGEIDLLSIDIDGNDFHIWKEINSINPRVVVIEYNAFLGQNKSLTVKYDASFDRYKKHKSGRYFGASITALNKLAESKGYILVGCDSYGINAFFVRKDITKKELLAISPKEAYFPRSDLGMEGTLAEFEKIKHLEFEDV